MTAWFWKERCVPGGSCVSSHDESIYRIIREEGAAEFNLRTTGHVRAPIDVRTERYLTVHHLGFGWIDINNM